MDDMRSRGFAGRNRLGMQRKEPEKQREQSFFSLNII
jgi:hypothetical protein